MSTTRYKIRLWEYDGEASVANAVTFDSFAEAEARFNDLRVSEEMPCVEFIKERIANGCIIGDEVLNVRQFASVFDAIPQSASARRRRAERTSTFGFTRSNSRSPMKTTPRRATVSNLLRRRSSDSLSSVPTDCGRLNTSQSLRTAWRRLGSLLFVSLTTRAVNRISKGGTAGSLKRLPALFCYERN